MDEFDTSIQQAKQVYEPKKQFVEETMQKILSKQPRKQWSVKTWIPVLAGGLAVLALVFIALPTSHRHTAVSTKKSTPSTSTQPNTSQTASTNDAGLASDLNDIASSMSQENNDQNEANTALNDSAQQITVPTD